MITRKGLSKRLAELSEDYLKLLETSHLGWQEAGRLGATLAQYDARVKTRVDSDTRLRAAEDKARVSMARQTAMDVFWTGLLNGEYDEGHIPVPTEPAGEYDDEDLEEECD